MRFVKSLLRICVFARDALSGRSRVCWATSPSTLRQPALRPAFCGFCRAATASFMSTTAIRVTDPSRPKCACGLWSTVIGANFLAATIRVPPVVFKRARPACCWSGATSGWWLLLRSRWRLALGRGSCPGPAAGAVTGARERVRAGSRVPRDPLSFRGSPQRRGLLVTALPAR
ncbi:ORFL235W [Human betaherpesvirus 5]|nr:ORFL235W [Human betaherpesvirus 5]QHX40605.1 ORFL235W [Human betaherpesvirus 5]